MPFSGRHSGEQVICGRMKSIVHHRAFGEDDNDVDERWHVELETVTRLRGWKQKSNESANEICTSSSRRREVLRRTR